MPIPNIIVFDTKYANDIITEFEALGFNPFYNNKVVDFTWFTDNIENVVNNHKLYWLYENRLYQSTVGELVHGDIDIIPNFCIIFNETVYDNIWHGLKEWLEVEVFSFSASTLFKTDEHLKIDNFLERPDSGKAVYDPAGDDIVYEGLEGKCLTSKPEKFDQPEYSWRCRYVSSCDKKYYEVVRSNTKLPFTVVVSNYVFSKKDDTLFFTDIYGSNDWDYNRIDCKYDYLFLCRLWKNLGLPGAFSVDIVKKRVDSCYIERIPVGETPSPEPVVYRRSMEDVISATMKRKNAEFLPDFIKK